MTISVLADKGIFLKFIQNDKPKRAVIDDDIEQEVDFDDEGLYATKESNVISLADSNNGSIYIQEMQESPMSKGAKQVMLEDIYKSHESGSANYTSQEFASAKDLRDPKMNTMPMPLSPTSQMDAQFAK